MSEPLCEHDHVWNIDGVGWGATCGACGIGGFIYSTGEGDIVIPVDERGQDD